jgi:hypothetical protein
MSCHPPPSFSILLSVFAFYVRVCVSVCAALSLAQGLFKCGAGCFYPSAHPRYIYFFYLSFIFADKITRYALHYKSIAHAPRAKPG